MQRQGGLSKYKIAIRLIVLVEKTIGIVKLVILSTVNLWACHGN